MAYRLGVDMGTTFTAAAVATGVSPTLLELGNRALQIPSVLFLTDEGDFLVGEAAEHRALAEPERVVREFKRRIGDTVPVLITGVPYSPQALTARLLGHVVSSAKVRMGEDPDRVVLTHPANWGPYKLELLDQVGVMAGLGPVELVAEPLAAAAQYAHQTRVDFGDTIAVYDLGGGTFDACVLRKERDGFSVLGNPEGIEHLGGIDFDEALFRYVLDQVGSPAKGSDPDDKGLVQGLARLRRDCVDAKEALSTDIRTIVPIILPGLSTRVMLQRAEFERLIRPALTDTMQALHRTIESAGLEPYQLRSIVLVGGSSRIPLVGELLSASFEVPLALDTHPKHDVALGAVRAVATTGRAIPPRSSGAGSAGPKSPSASLTSPALPVMEVRPARRRRGWVLGIVGVVLIAGALAAAVVGLRPGRASDGARAMSGQSSATALARPSLIATTPSPAVAKPSPAAAKPSPAVSLPSSQALSRDELVVARRLHNTDWELFLANVTSPTPGRRLTEREGVDSAPVLSPDRKTVIYIRIAKGGVRSLRVAGASNLSGDRVLFPLPQGCTRPLRPAWNPTDAGTLAIGCQAGTGRTTVRLMRTDGTVVATVDPPAGRTTIDDFAFSADGRRLGFWASSNERATDGTLFTVALSGGRPEPVFTSGGLEVRHDADLAFSPDGKHIAFSRRDGTGSDLMVAGTDGSDAVRLITGAGHHQAPAWSPDGSRIAYKSDAPTAHWPGKQVPRIWVTSSTRPDPHLLWTRNAPEQQSTPAWR
ncbi:MAG TPA: Hsp70 family protein [Microlunatus sp.]|nr:Hsp70 family protein [Microlunatus sp.]